MTRKAEAIRAQIIESIVHLAQQSSEYPNKEILGSFIRQFYGKAASDDLQSRSAEHLTKSVLSLWQTFIQKKTGQPNIVVFNEKNTIILIVHEDVPFFLDSILMELNRRHDKIVFLHQLGNLQTERDNEGALISVQAHSSDNNEPSEVAVYIELKALANEDECTFLKNDLYNIAEDVSLAVSDWPAMQEKTRSLKVEDDSEAKEFLKWIVENHFTFLGYYETDYDRKTKKLSLSPNTELGITRRKHQGKGYEQSCFVDLDEACIDNDDLIITGKTSFLSTVHRSVYADFISIKKYNSEKECVGEYKFVGLYTSSAYNWRPTYIPLLRIKVQNILRRANVPAKSHDGKMLLHIIETLPRDDIFLGTEEDLYDLVQGILSLRERSQIKLFVRRDLFKRYYSCFVFVPKDIFDSEMRKVFSDILLNEFESTGITFSTLFSDSSILARIHFMVRVEANQDLDVNVDRIEQKLIQSTRTWSDNLSDALYQYHDSNKAAELVSLFSHAFPASYQEQFTPDIAVQDILHLEHLDVKPISMAFYDSKNEKDEFLHFKAYVSTDSLILSNIVPIFEHLGLRAIGERPHCIVSHLKKYWIHDFTLLPESNQIVSLGSVKDIFYDAFYHAWAGQTENDHLNKLVLASGITWREISMLRAYSRYLRQVGFTYSQNYIEQALFEHANIAKQLVALFSDRFAPSLPLEMRSAEIQTLTLSIENELEKVSSLDHDRILRRFLAVILGTLRTNFFQTTVDGGLKPYLSFKLDPRVIPDIPLPLPMFEIFVYSPRMEGVHLRNAKVARGGIRWSDRFEDYRTEVLGLVKAQQVKNAVIVPLGAKGGFVCKQMPKTQNREDILNEGIACYQFFIQGLLDLTDNLKEGEIVPAQNVVRYDEDDIYLVVAADKGTASFSDIANKIAVDRQFWLGDAFASGGSAGYDHKKMGITARGAWESVKRHFRERGHDTQSQDFTVIGIGDMSGDVFGNGMLLSRHIKLLAAFNHIHIFIDPNPDVEISFMERQRLFDLPRSNWTDYNAALIAAGGGVFLRSAKSIPISPEMKKCFGITKDKMEPNELIQALLTAPVDLLWNGGIGTYVKSRSASHLEVGDKNNDGLRVNGEDLRCKVVGEGGNIGFTQLGRVEYALKGGSINTDAIDNSAGVDCSDHEVNIKILLNAVMTSGKLDQSQRNVLLSEMTDEVAELVLQHNRHQTEALSLAQYKSEEYIEMHTRLIHFLEEETHLNRRLEFLPSDEELLQRKQKNQGLTRPELSVLLAYTKILLKENLLASDIPENPAVAKNIRYEFPEILSKLYPEEMKRHRLSREIIVTLLTNSIVDEVGLTFLHRLQDETGAGSAEIVRAYIVAREIFEVSSIRKLIRGLDSVVSAEVKIKMLQELNRLIRRGTRWFLRHRRSQTDLEKEMQLFGPGVRQVVAALPNALKGAVHRTMLKLSKELMNEQVPTDLAMRIGAMGGMCSALDIVDAATEHDFPLEKMVETYYAVGSRLDLGWFREQIKKHPVHNNWDALARAAFRDDLDSKQRDVTVSILKMDSPIEGVDARIEAWIIKQAAVMHRWRQMITALKESPDDREFTRFAVTLRELQELINF